MHKARRKQLEGKQQILNEKNHNKVKKQLRRLYNPSRHYGGKGKNRRGDYQTRGQAQKAEGNMKE